MIKHYKPDTRVGISIIKEKIEQANMYLLKQDVKKANHQVVGWLE